MCLNIVSSEYVCQELTFHSQDLQWSLGVTGDEDIAMIAWCHWWWRYCNDCLVIELLQWSLGVTGDEDIAVIAGWWRYCNDYSVIELLQWSLGVTGDEDIAVIAGWVMKILQWLLGDWAIAVIAWCHWWWRYRSDCWVMKILHATVCVLEQIWMVSSRDRVEESEFANTINGPQ